MLIGYPSDLVGAQETITATGAGVVAQYPLTNLHDGLPTEVCRFDSNVQTRIIWDSGGPAVTIEGFMLIMHTLAAGAVLAIEANPTNAWGAPAFSQNVVVPTWPDHLPANITVDLRGTLLATTGYRWRSLLIPAQAVNHGLGELLWIAQWEPFDRRCVWPVRRAEVRAGVITNMTSNGVSHIVEPKVRQWRLRPRLPYLTDADTARVLRLTRAAGASLGWPVILNPDNVASEDSALVRFHPDSVKELEHALTFLDRTEITLDLLEIQRGRPL